MAIFGRFDDTFALSWHIGPLLGQIDHGRRIHHAITERMTYKSIHTILLPIDSGQVLWSWRFDYQMLNVSPRQIRIGFQRQGYDASS